MKNKVGNIWKDAIVSLYESHSSLRNKENNAKNLSQYGRCSVSDSNFIPPSRIHFTHRQTYESQNDQGRVVLVPAGKEIFLHYQSVQADSGFTHPHIQREGDFWLKFDPKASRTQHTVLPTVLIHIVITEPLFKRFSVVHCFFNLAEVITVTSWPHSWQSNSKFGSLLITESGNTFSMIVSWEEMSLPDVRLSVIKAVSWCRHNGLAWNWPETSV
jgi:hypothetical protein